jgi:nicotinate-nucleotide adenylyltransferase
VHGILGGTFDPPHIGHLAVANAALEQLDVEVVRLIPAGDPWQKRDEQVTDARHRLAMTRLAASEDPRFVVDDLEIRRSGPSYMVDTIEQLGGPCTLILGADAARNLLTWHRAATLLEMVEVAVVPRPGVGFSDVCDALGRPVIELSMPTIDLSGTQIRSHISRGHSPRFLVPDAVCDYIASNGLYR